MSYEQSRRSMPFNSDKILAEFQRENAMLKEEQIRLNGQLRNYVVANQKLVHENQVLLDENQELSELCLYLDDERIRLLKMIEEWEKCGRYYFEKLSSDISSCCEQMNKLEGVKNSVMKENNDVKEVLTSAAGISDILRRRGDGSSSPSPSLDAEVRSKVPQSSSVLLSPPFSDSDESLSRNNSGQKQFSIYQVKRDGTDVSTIGRRAWNRSSQDIYKDSSMNSTTYNRLNLRRESSPGDNESPQDVNISKNSTLPVPENKQVARTENHLGEDSLGPLQPYSVRSASLSRPTEERRAFPVHPTEVLFSHPFKKVPSNPSFEMYAPNNNSQHWQQPQLQRKKMTSSSSSSLATDSKTPGKMTHDYHKPLQPPVRTSVVAQQLRVRSASVTPSGFQPHIIGYYPVECPEKPSDWRQVNKDRGRENETSRREQNVESRPFAYKTSF